MSQKPVLIYLDNHSTTPCDPRVVEAMLPYLTYRFGNASSVEHESGRDAGDAVQMARSQVASLLGAKKSEVIFTSGATESNNLAILGVAQAEKGIRRKIVTSSIEHKSVISPILQLRQHGFEVVIVPVDKSGCLDLAQVKSEIDEKTLLLSIQAANHEIGTIQPIKELAIIAHEHGALIHCDATQAVGKIPFSNVEYDCDFISFSSHKLYGPKGIGALFVKGGIDLSRVTPITYGGNQEQGLRPGTLNVPAIVGFGEACRLCQELIPDERNQIGVLRDQLEESVLKGIPTVRRNGFLSCRLSGNCSLTFPGIAADALIANLPTLCLSTGSACTSGALEPSQVLTALGISYEDAYSTIRIGIGRFNTSKDIAIAGEMILAAYAEVNRLS